MLLIRREKEGTINLCRKHYLELYRRRKKRGIRAFGNQLKKAGRGYQV